MPQRYTATHTKTLTAVGDLIEITAPATGIVRVRRCYVSQDNVESTAGSDMVAVIWQRASVVGSGGTTLTPSKIEALQAAASSTVKGANTSAATLTGSPLHYDSFNILSSWAWEPDDSGPVLAPSAIGVLKLISAPTASTQFKITVLFEEVG